MALRVTAVRRGLLGESAPTSGVTGATLTALPEFLLAAILLVIFAVGLHWLPPYGWGEARHMVLPALSLGLPAGGLLGRLFSDGLTASFSERWVATWHVAGFGRRRIALAVLKRTLPSLLPQVGLVIVGLTGGAIAVEQVFSIPGLGRATLGAASAQDLPALQTGILLLLTIAVVLGGAAGLGRTLLLGRTLRAGAIPVTRHEPHGGRWQRVVPAVVALLLVIIIVAGIMRDPLTSSHLRLPGIALALAALGFLGPRPPAPEWGLILAEGIPYLERAPWAVLMSVLAVSLSNLRRRG